MAYSKEAEDLRKQIAFLTNLIKSAKQPEPKLKGKLSFVNQTSHNGKNQNVWHGHSSAVSSESKQTLHPFEKHKYLLRKPNVSLCTSNIPNEVAKHHKHQYSFKRNKETVHHTFSSSVVSTVSTNHSKNNISSLKVALTVPDKVISSKSSAKSEDGDRRQICVLNSSNNFKSTAELVKNLQLEVSNEKTNSNTNDLLTKPRITSSPDSEPESKPSTCVLKNVRTETAQEGLKEENAHSALPVLKHSVLELSDISHDKIQMCEVLESSSLQLQNNESGEPKTLTQSRSLTSLSSLPVPGNNRTVSVDDRNCRSNHFASSSSKSVSSLSNLRRNIFSSSIKNKCLKSDQRLEADFIPLTVSPNYLISIKTSSSLSDCLANSNKNSSDSENCSQNTQNKLVLSSDSLTESGKNVSATDTDQVLPCIALENAVISSQNSNHSDIKQGAPSGLKLSLKKSNSLSVLDTRTNTPVKTDKDNGSVSVGKETSSDSVLPKLTLNSPDNNTAVNKIKTSFSTGDSPNKVVSKLLRKQKSCDIHSSLASAAHTSSLQSPSSSPLRMKKVASILSDLQKTQSKIENLKENIDGILNNKLPQQLSVKSDTLQLTKKSKRGNRVDIRKLLKQKKLLGKVWMRQKSVDDLTNISARSSASSCLKSKYRIVKNHSLSLSGNKTSYSSVNGKSYKPVNLTNPSTSSVQQVARVIVGKYKTSHFSSLGSSSKTRFASPAFCTSKFNTKKMYNRLNFYYGDYGYSVIPSWRKAYIGQRTHLLKGYGYLASRSHRLLEKFSSKNRLAGRKVIFIDGIPYKSNRTKLTKTGNRSVDHRKSTTILNKIAALRKLIAGSRIISVRGVKFQMDPNGHSLKRINSIQDNTASTSAERNKNLPKISRVDIGGSTYIQISPGTLVKTSSSYTRTVTSRIKNRSILSAAAKYRKDNTRVARNLCKYYHRFGKCHRGISCHFIHDPDRIAICTRFLRGTCKIEGCLFSHKVSKEKVPVCSYFLRGVCNRDNCPYLHVKVNRNAAVCPDFINGFCPQGEKCKKQHTHECPAFSKTGVCPNPDTCKMIHRQPRRIKKPFVSRVIPGPSTSSGVVPCKPSAVDAHFDADVDAAPAKRLPSYISLKSYNVDDILTPKSNKLNHESKGLQLRIKPQL